MTRWLNVLIVLTLTWPWGMAKSAAQSQPPRGFIATRAEQHQALEDKFDAAIKADQLRDWMAYLSSRPHHVGSPFGKEIA